MPFARPRRVAVVTSPDTRSCHARTAAERFGARARQGSSGTAATESGPQSQILRTGGSPAPHFLRGGGVDPGKTPEMSGAAGVAASLKGSNRMGSVNKVILVGNLGRDAELRYTPGGAPVATLNLATTEVWNDKGGQKQEKTEWHRVVLWGKSAESLNEYLVKGKQIYVEGRLQTRQWDDKDGNKRYTTEIRGDRIVLLSGGGGGMGGGGRSSNRGGAAPQDEPMGGEMGAELTDDDIPF